MSNLSDDPKIFWFSGVARNHLENRQPVSLIMQKRGPDDDDDADANDEDAVMDGKREAEEEDGGTETGAL